MNSPKINIIEFPSNLGLKKKNHEIEPGVNQLPDWLRQHGFHQRLNPVKVVRVDPPLYSMKLDSESGIRNAQKIIEYSIKQSEALVDLLNGECFNLVIGGDCSILIGNALALRQSGHYGLFFLDGHTDFITPDLSETGGAAGMDLAIVTGYGHPKLTDILNLQPYFKEEEVFCVGNREYDPEYVKPILESNINYFDLKKLRETGISNLLNQFLKMVKKHKLDGFFIHLDVDVLHDSIMPAVDSRAEGGLWYSEFTEILRPLIKSQKCIGIEITILDPNLDLPGQYTRRFVDSFVDLLV